MAARPTGDEPPVPLHQRVLEALLEDILTGKYAAGQKFPSEAALVQRFHTSRITVGRAVKELERRGLVERVAGSGTYVRPNAADRPTFVLLVPDLGRTDIFDPICRGIVGTTQASGYRFVWAHEGDPVETCRRLVDEGISGVFFAPLEEVEEAAELNAQIAALLEHSRAPVVLLDRCYFPYPFRSPFDLVGIDNRRAGYVAAEHLIEAGAMRIAFLGHARAAWTVDARLAGYRESLHVHGYASTAVRLDELGPDALMEAHRQANADAYVCANDRTAGLLMHALLEHGIRVPEDVRVVGIDDVEYAATLPVPLTTVRQPCRAIGQAALGAMLDRIARPGVPARDTLVDCRLIVRHSG